MKRVEIDERVVSCDDAEHLSAMASELGWGPGMWPEHLVLVGPPASQAAIAFDFSEAFERDGEYIYVKYAGENGQELMVFND